MPDALWKYGESGLGKKYSDNQSEDVIHNDAFMSGFDEWVKSFTAFVQQKGKIEPGKYRAYGYSPPPHLFDEIKTGIRAFKLRMGIAPEGSSNEIQKKLDLIKDETWKPRKTEGEKLRGK